MPDPLPPEDAAWNAAIDAALAAYSHAMNPPMVDCKRCEGRGYHHGFGETGHDPDWCTECGGAGYVLAYSIDPADAIRALRKEPGDAAE